MRKLRVVFGLAAALLAAGLLAGGPASWAEGLEWGGELRAELSLPAGEDFRFAEGAVDSGLLRLGLSLEAKPSERFGLYAEAALKAQGLPGSLASLDDLASLESLAPLGFELVEAYADVYGFLFPQLDLRVGRQRIVWGTAERVSVVDNVNPLNLEDPWDFGRRLAERRPEAEGLPLRADPGGRLRPLFHAGPAARRRLHGGEPAGWPACRPRGARDRRSRRRPVGERDPGRAPGRDRGRLGPGRQLPVRPACACPRPRR